MSAFERIDTMSTLNLSKMIILIQTLWRKGQHQGPGLGKVHMEKFSKEI